MSRNINIYPIVNMTFGPFNGDNENNSQTVEGDMTGNQTINGKINGGYTTGQEGCLRIDRDQTKAGQMIIASERKIEVPKVTQTDKIVNMTFSSFNGDNEKNSQTVEGDITGNQTINGKINGGYTTGQEGCLRTDRDQTKAGQMIIASDLKIEHSEKCVYWKWVKDPRATRFTEVAELLQVWFFYIQTSMNFLGLSANTKYGAYLIFKTTEDSEGLDSIMNSSVSVGRNKEEKYVCLKPTTATPRNIVWPKEWSDEWFELELGQFYCDIVTNKEALIIIHETSGQTKKTGLIVAGVEIRPI